MKPLALASLLALAAPAADAGDVGFRIGIGIQHKGVSVRVGVGNTGHGVKRAPTPVPAPRWIYRRPRRPQRIWVPGRYEVVQTKVWVPAYTRKVWRPAQYGHRRDHCGFRVRYVVRPAHWETIYVPGYWEYRTQKVWRPGHYEVSPRARHRRGHRF